MGICLPVPLDTSSSRSTTAAGWAIGPSAGKATGPTAGTAMEPSIGSTLDIDAIKGGDQKGESTVYISSGALPGHHSARAL